MIIVWNSIWFLSTLYIICLFLKHVLEAFIGVSFLYVQCQKVHLIGLDILIDISMSFLAVIVYALFSFPPFSPWWSSMQYSLIMLWCCEILIAGLIFAEEQCVGMMIAMATLACTLVVCHPVLDHVTLNTFSVDMEGNIG